jgi:hypothetical protein
MPEDEFVDRHPSDHRFSRRSNLRAGTEQFPEPGAYASHHGKESTPTQFANPTDRSRRAACPRTACSLRATFAGRGSRLGSLVSACAISHSGTGIHAEPARPEAGALGSGRDGLRLVRATRDQLGVAWSAQTEPLSWQVVCWDSRDAAVARLKLSGTHRRARTGAGSAARARARPASG